MQSEGIGWSDIGNVIEPGAECDDGKFTEAEMQQFGQAMRAEGVEAGIKIGMARAGNGGGNGTSRCRHRRRWRSTAISGSVN